MIGDGQTMNVSERPHPQVAQHHFGGGHQSHIGDTSQQHDQNHDHRRSRAGRNCEAGTEALVGQQPLVDHLLDKYRNDQATDRSDDGKKHREPQAAYKFGALGETSAKDRHRAKASFIRLLFRGCGQRIMFQCNRVIERRCVFHHGEFVVGLSRQLILIRSGLVAR